MDLILKNVLVDGKKNDISVENGRIREIAENLEGSGETCAIVEGEGLTALPGFIDLHCHLREPGFEYKEDVASGCRAAVAGGFTTVCCMPNTQPAADNPVVIRYILERAKEVNLAKVLPIGAVSKGQKGGELAELGLMKAAGAIAFSDDGAPVENANLMRLALEYCKGIKGLVISHCEDKLLANGGAVNEGKNATLAGLPGITRAAEEVMVARDILIAEALGARVHIAHVSTKGSVQLVREAKARGVAVTCETCPHYVAGTDELILNYDTNAKVNPPLREEADRRAIVAGLADGTVDCLATDHAPHHEEDKNLEFCLAANGISGFETAFALAYTELVKGGKMTLAALSERMSAAPAKILGLENPKLKKDGPADIVLADERAVWRIDKNAFFSKGKNTPFHEREVNGMVAYTVVGGRVKYAKGRISE